MRRLAKKEATAAAVAAAVAISFNEYMDELTAGDGSAADVEMIGHASIESQINDRYQAALASGHVIDVTVD